MFWQAALLVGQLWLGELTRQRPKRVSFKEFVENNAPSETRPIPYAGGEIELTPVRQWYGDFKQRAVERDSHWTDYVWAGLFAGFLDFITVAYRYYVGEMFPLCFGPDAHVRRITINDRLVFLSTADNAGGQFLIDDPQAWGGDQPPGEGGEYAFCRLTRGNYTDPANAYLESLLATPPNKTPSLRGISTLVKLGPSGETESGYFAAGGVGVIPRLKEWKVTIARYPDNLNTGFNKIGKHMNPMEVIYEWATSIEFGARVPLEELNIPNWQQVAQDLAEEGTGWSGRIESATSPREVIDDVLAQIDGVLDPSPSNGLTMRLIRRAYSIGSLRTLTRDDITRVVRFTPGTYEDTKNKVQVEFPNQDNSFEEGKAIYIDPANQQIQGGRIVPESKTFLGVADSEQANILVTRDGRAISLPRAPLECFAKPSWGRLSYRSEVVVFEWESPSISIVMRVQEITPNGPDEKDFHLVLIEDQFATGLRTFGESGGTSHTDPGTGLDTAPPSASWDTAGFPPDGLTFNLQLTNTNQFQATITGGITFGSYAPGGQLARIWVTEPGGVQTLSPIRLSPDTNDEATFQWPALAAGVYEFCIQTFSLRGATNGVKVCADITVANIGSPSASPSSSISPSVSPSVSPSASESSSASSSVSPSASGSPSVSSSPSASISPSPSVSPSSSDSPSAPSFGDGPDTITDLELWLDAFQIVGLSNDQEITTWEDESGNNRDATGVLITDFKPRYRTTDGPSSMPAVRLVSGAEGDKGGYFTLPNFLTSFTAGHGFAVVKMDSGNDNSTPAMSDFGTGTNFANFYAFSDNRIFNDFGSTVHQEVPNGYTGTHPVTVWHIFEVRATASAWSARIDGDQVHFTGTNTVAWSTTPFIGHRALDNGFSRGLVAEVFMYSRILNGTEYTTIKDYILAKYNITMI